MFIRQVLIASCIWLALLFPTGCVSTNSANSTRTRHPTTSDPNFHHVTLLSWRSPSGQWCFSLKEGDRVDKKIKTEAAFRLCGLDALEARLRELPPGSYINWNKYRAIGFDYPPPEQIEEVQRFAKKIGLYLYFNFIMEE